jgi:hypothetical protein
MSRDQGLILLSVAIPIVLIALGMVLGWRARRRRQSEVRRPASPPAELGPVLLSEDMLYVATTRADSPLDRIVVAGLGFRARAVVTVAEAGIRLELAGQEAVFLPTAALETVGRATWTIDRAVSNDGLVFVRWSQSAADDTLSSFDSYFRPAAPEELVDAIQHLIPTIPTPPTSAGAAA